MQVWQIEQELKELPKRQKEEEDRLASAEMRKAEADAAGDNIASAAIDDEIRDIKGYAEEIAEHIKSLEDEVNALNSRRGELAAAVRPEHLLIYDRLRVNRHPTIVKLANGVCGGCHLKQPPATEHLVKRDNQLVTCEMCGRILY